MTHIATPAPERTPITNTVAPMKMRIGRMVSIPAPANKTPSRPRTMTYQTAVRIWLPFRHRSVGMKKPRRSGASDLERNGTTRGTPWCHLECSGFERRFKGFLCETAPWASVLPDCSTPSVSNIAIAILTPNRCRVSFILRPKFRRLPDMPPLICLLAG